MKRRSFLLLAAGMPLAASGVGRLVAAATPTNAAGGKDLQDIRENWRSLLPAEADVSLSTEPLELSAQQWAQRLDEARFGVLREEDTERPGSSPLNDEKRAGIYACAGCGLPLFSSQMKFDSGTGWPSFFTSIPNHLATRKDYKLLIMPRTEYHCVRCGGHQGHIFHDGPAPTGERWCNNGLALRFIPA